MCKLNKCICSKGNKCPVAYPTFPGSLTGNNGWSPLLSVVVDAVNLDIDGNDRDILQLVGWSGGTGTTPTDYVGQYLGTTGFVPLIINGTNIRGAQGSGADNTGWTDVPLGGMSIVNSPGPSSGDFYNRSDIYSPPKFIVNSLNAGSFKYKQIGKTMFVSFYILGSASIINELNGSFWISLAIKIPNGKTAQTQGMFSSVFSPSGGGAPYSSSLERVPYDVGNWNTLFINGINYIAIDIRLSNGAGGTSTNFAWTGSGFFEID